MAFNQENLNVYKRILPFTVKVAIWIDAWDSKKEELSQILLMLVGLRKSLASMAHVVREASVEYSTPWEEIDKARDKALMRRQVNRSVVTDTAFPVPCTSCSYPHS